MFTDGIQISITSDNTSCDIEIRFRKKEFFRIIIPTNQSIELDSCQGYIGGCFEAESISVDEENT